MNSQSSIGVIIPCYKVKKQILKVISLIGSECERIYVVDDACPEGSGRYVEECCKDDRVKVLYNNENKGVGGAVIRGYREAIKDDIKVFVKLDGDGQMDPKLISQFVEPILKGEADYTKGNRFFNLDSLNSMPTLRLFGNSILSLITKISSGYWNIFDPTNGYTAIHQDVVKLLPLERISERYFFETDMLFSLNYLRALVIDIPMDARYGCEVSSLKVSRILGEFIYKHIRNFFKRLFINYYLRDMSLASFCLPLGLILSIFGTSYGLIHWFQSSNNDTLTPAGTVVLSALCFIIGLQLLFAFIVYDIKNVPVRAIHKNH